MRDSTFNIVDLLFKSHLTWSLCLPAMLSGLRSRLSALSSVLSNWQGSVLSRPAVTIPFIPGPIPSIARASTAAATSAPDDQVGHSEVAHSRDIIRNVNNQLKDAGRLFAVVHLAGKQFKVTPGDILIIEGYWPPQNGDKIRLDKVLLAGGKDFSLIGTPLVQPGLVDVQATVIEKTLSHTRTHFKSKRRKQFMRINFYRSENTMVRINSIGLTRPVDQ